MWGVWKWPRTKHWFAATAEANLFTPLVSRHSSPSAASANRSDARPAETSAKLRRANAAAVSAVAIRESAGNRS